MRNLNEKQENYFTQALSKIQSNEAFIKLIKTKVENGLAQTKFIMMIIQKKT